MLVLLIRKNNRCDTPLKTQKAAGQFLSPTCAITGALPIFYICSVNFQKATKNPPTGKCIGITQSLIHAFSSRKWLFCFLSFQTMKLLQTVMIVPAMITTGKKISQMKKILHCSCMAVYRIFVFLFAAMLNMVDHALVRCGFYNAICCHMPKTQQKKSDTVAHCSRCALRSSIAYRRNNFIFLRSNKVIKTPENKWYL